MEIVLCLLILSISILVFYYFFNLEDNKVQPSVAEVQPKKVKKVVVEPKNFESVTILSCLGPSNTCIAIFKNPWSHKTHFYRTRLKGNFEDGCAISLRNLAALIRLWGSSWSNINNIRIYETDFQHLQEANKWVNRLQDQSEDCQTKFGCRIEFLDLLQMKDADKKVLGVLQQKILDNCISEDDLHYFHLQDDTSLIHKTYFDL